LVATINDSMETLSSTSASMSPGSFCSPKILLTCGFNRSASTSNTDTSRSRAMLKARLMLVKVLPSPGSALVTMTIRGSRAGLPSVGAIAFWIKGRLI
jgi:hypothetical protein